MLYLVLHNLDGVAEQPVNGASLRDRPIRKNMRLFITAEFFSIFYKSRVL